MKTEWFSHLKDPQAQESFKDYVKNSNILLDRLKEMCYSRLNSVDKSSTTDYSKASWAYEQADKIGYTRALKEIIELLTLKDNS